jgi:hypothetical protein
MQAGISCPVDRPFYKILKKSQYMRIIMEVYAAGNDADGVTLRD